MKRKDNLEAKSESLTKTQGRILGKDLIDFLKDNRLWYGQDKGITNSSLRKFIISLYGNSYRGRQFKRVSDIYSLTQEDMSDLAYKMHCPFGEKTLTKLNEVLSRNKLPTLQAHEVYTFSARIY